MNDSFLTLELLENLDKKLIFEARLNRDNTTVVRVSYFLSVLPIFIELFFILALVAMALCSFWINENVKGSQIVILFNSALWIVGITILVIFRFLSVRSIIKSKGTDVLKVDKDNILIPSIYNNNNGDIEIARREINNITLYWSKHQVSYGAGHKKLHSIVIQGADGKEIKIPANTMRLIQLSYILLSNGYDIKICKIEKDLLYKVRFVTTILLPMMLVVGMYFAF